MLSILSWNFLHIAPRHEINFKKANWRKCQHQLTFLDSCHCFELTLPFYSDSESTCLVGSLRSCRTGRRGKDSAAPPSLWRICMPADGCTASGLHFWLATSRWCQWRHRRRDWNIPFVHDRRWDKSPRDPSAANFPSHPISDSRHSNVSHLKVGLAHVPGNFNYRNAV